MAGVFLDEIFPDLLVFLAGDDALFVSLLEVLQFLTKCFVTGGLEGCATAATPGKGDETQGQKRER